MNAIKQQKDYYEHYWENRAGYSGDSQGYAQNFRNWMRAELKALPRDARILEVGCGDGSFTKDLATFSSNVTAIDISAEQVEQNKRAYPQIDFRQHDVAELFPFADRTFDIIWCSEVLEHLFDPAYALQEMHRIMAPGGKLLVTVPHHGFFKNLLITLFKWDAHFVPSNPHIRFYSRNTLGQLVKTSGFDEIKMGTCGMNKPFRDVFVHTNILLKAKKSGSSQCHGQNGTFDRHGRDYLR